MIDTGISEEEKAVIPEEVLSYDGYQVVRSEFFSHLTEPSISFSGHKFYVNTACLKKMPHVEYVMILIHTGEKKLILQPCDEDARDGYLWCLTKDDRRKPRTVSGRIFVMKVMTLMDWNPDYRYKLLGKRVRHKDEVLIIFDLTAVEVYPRILKEGESPKASRTPVYPAEWEYQFGLPVEEHKKQLQISTVNGYTVFDVYEGRRRPEKEKEDEAEHGTNAPDHV